MHDDASNHERPGVPVSLDGAEFPVVVGSEHVGVDVKLEELGTEVAIERSIAVEDHVVDGDAKLDAHAVAK
jgi:hypothetical protein